MKKLAIYWKVAIVLALIAISYFLASLVKPFLVGNYGIDPIKVGLMFLIAEIFFDLGIAIFLWFSGVKKMNLKLIKELKVCDIKVDCRNPGAVVGIIVNRASWITPFAYILLTSWTRLPWFIDLGILAEMAITIWVGLAIFGLNGVQRT